VVELVVEKNVSLCTNISKFPHGLFKTGDNFETVMKQHNVSSGYEVFELRNVCRTNKCAL